MAAHGLRKLRVASVNGALFGTLADDVEPVEDISERQCWHNCAVSSCGQ
jgi:hypothetical protein